MAIPHVDISINTFSLPASFDFSRGITKFECATIKISVLVAHYGIEPLNIFNGNGPYWVKDLGLSTRTEPFSSCGNYLLMLSQQMLISPKIEG
ncbi:hypothetical protein ACG98H_12135 [Corynebacterium sp. L4756]|uniref:hypothetical protein n=1 Tax=unclassified Corynebacterium TaxID=2624378 RepID=UPI00374DE7B5